MSAEIAYLINLDKEGKIDDSALNKALNTLRLASAQPKMFRKNLQMRHLQKK